MSRARPGDHVAPRRSRPFAPRVPLTVVLVMTLALAGTTPALSSTPALAADGGEDDPGPTGNVWIDERRVANIAHAGGIFEAPQNTLYAFRTAEARGADVVEMDLHVSADGHVVVVHDSTVDRTTDGTGCVVGMTLDELKSLDAAHTHVPGQSPQSGRPDGDYPYRGVATGAVAPPSGFEANDFTIPTLEEVFLALPDSYLVIEMKPTQVSAGYDCPAVLASYPEGERPDIVAEVARLVDEHDVADRVMVASFIDDLMHRFVELAPHVDTSYPLGEGLGLYAAFLAGAPPPNPFGHVAIQAPTNIEGITLTRELVEWARGHGIAVHFWTINDEAQMAELLDWGADGIITDRVTVLDALLEARGDPRPGPPAPPASISGEVVGPDGEPVAGAPVLAYADGDAWVGRGVAFTGPDGTYTVDGLEPGTYRVMFRGAPGASLVRRWFGDVAHRVDAPPVHLGPGEAATGVDGVLAAGGWVTGTVRGPDGEPLEGVVVWAYSDQDRWIGTEATRTGTDGTYRIEGLPPGGYRLVFGPPAESGLPLRWWDGIGVERRVDAALVSVGPGAGVDGVDLWLADRPVPAFAAGDCWWPLPGNFPADVTITCGTVDVPADHGAPGAGTVTLAVARLSRAAADPGASPVLRLHGGPGGSSLSGPPTGTAGLDVLAERDIILFDQRGGGHSLPDLSCPEVELAVVDALAADASLPELLGPSRDAAAACRDRLRGEGIDLDQYHTLASVADIEHLRVAFGAKRWNLWGGSYGTRLGLAYARAHPDRVRSLVADSVYPPHLGSAERTMQLAPDALDRLVAECAGDDACAEAFGDLGARLDAAVASFDADPEVITGLVPIGGTPVQRTFTLNGSDLRAGLFSALYDSSLVPLLPSLIDDLADGDRSIVPAFLTIGVPRLVGFSEGARYSIECADNGSLLEGSDVVGERPPGHEDRTFYVTIAHSYCPVWDVAPLAPAFNEPATPEVPTLVFAGTLDPVTPYEISRDQAEMMPDARLVTVPRGGHGVARHDACTTAALQTFWADPTAELPGCVADIPAAPFVTP